jgi:hypothetical protein
VQDLLCKTVVGLGSTYSSLVVRIFSTDAQLEWSQILTNQYQPPGVCPKKSAETLCQGRSGILNGFNGS